MITSAISSRVQPTLSAPAMCTFSCGAAVPKAVRAATVAIWRAFRSSPGREDVAERELDQVAREVQGDVAQAGDDAVDLLPVDLGQATQATLVAGFHGSSPAYLDGPAGAIFEPAASQAAASSTAPTPATQAAQPKRSNTWPKTAVPTRPPKK